MKPDLHLVAGEAPPSAPAKPETVAERVRRLQAEAKALARDHAQAMGDALVAMHALAAEIHAGGDVYPAGVRAVARDVMQDCESRGQTLGAIMGRAP